MLISSSLIIVVAGVYVNVSKPFRNTRLSRKLLSWEWPSSLTLRTTVITCADLYFVYNRLAGYRTLCEILQLNGVVKDCTSLPNVNWAVFSGSRRMQHCPCDKTMNIHFLCFITNRPTADYFSSSFTTLISNIPTTTYAKALAFATI